MKFKPVLPLLFAVIVSVVACREETIILPAINDDSSIQSINGTWRVVSFEDRTTDSVIFPNQENSWGLEISVTFDDDAEPHKVQGRNTSNSIAGAFEYLNDRAIRVNELISTEAAQPPLGNEFSFVLQSDSLPFQVNDNELRLFYGNETKSVTLMRVE